MKFPKLGLFTRFFVLFGTTTILLALCLTAAYFVIDEEEAVNQLNQRYNSVVLLFKSISAKPINSFDINQYAEEVKGDVLIEKNGSRFTTNKHFPDISLLLHKSTQLKELHYVKFQSKYYLIYKSADGGVAITSTPFNLMVYSKWIVFWPWLLMVVIATASYFILRYWLAPIMDIFKIVRKVSTGDFSQRLNKHPNNEFSDLTLGINKMIDELNVMFEAKNELLLAVSHELRTPLARMKISLAMAETSDHLAEVENDLEQMNLLIEQLLEGERLQAGHRALHITKIYLPMLIDDILAESDVFKSIVIDGGIPEIVIFVDVGRLKFLIRNLLSNALKHNANDVKCTLSINQVRDALQIKVSDSGQGIPAASINHLFEPFYCVNDIHHRDTKGTGLGLYLCESIVKAHEGTITVESKIGQGTEFTVTLPMN